MAENQISNFGDLEKLALISESLSQMFKGRVTIILDLKSEEYKQMISMFREIDRHHKQFSIDISGTEFHFILDEDE